MRAVLLLLAGVYRAYAQTAGEGDVSGVGSSQCYQVTGGCEACTSAGNAGDQCGWCPSDPTNKCRPGTQEGATTTFSTCYGQLDQMGMSNGSPRWAFNKENCKLISDTSAPAIITLIVCLTLACCCGGAYFYRHWARAQEQKQQNAMTGIVIDGPALSATQTVPYGKEVAMPHEVWEEHVDANGKKFFYNPSTEATSWTKPVKVSAVVAHV